MTPEELATRRVEWLAERRILTADKQRIERRLAELDEILTVFAEGGK
jgi:hypothetical protein